MDTFHRSRKKGAALCGVLILALSIGCVLGCNARSSVHPIGGHDILDSEDFIVSNVLLPLGSMVYPFFCVSRLKYQAEANTGKGLRVHARMKRYFRLFCRCSFSLFFHRAVCITALVKHNKNNKKVRHMPGLFAKT